MARVSIERPNWARRLSTFFYLHPRVTLAVLLAPPLVWLGVIYLGSLAALLVNSFFYLDPFSGRLIRELSLSSYAQLFSPANFDIIARTTQMAAAVTVSAAALAFPLAYYMARYASPTLKAVLYLAVTLPLWSSYLIRVYSVKLILAKEGVVGWFITQVGLDPLLDFLLGLPGIGGPSLSISAMGAFLAFLYIWLPYMILPVETALARVPRSLLEASADLGARPAETFRRITFPLAFPGVVAGSIFTFSLTLGDYIIPSVLGNSSFFIGQVVLTHQGTAGNIPLAAAFTVVPILIMAVYLVIAKRLGAFDAL